MAAINVAQLLGMRHSPLRNYAIPGLTSWLIGQPSPMGCVRFFECSRTHEENIIPHSHRFDFQCLVIAGAVRNIVWADGLRGEGDTYAKSKLKYGGEPGKYEKEFVGVVRVEPTTHRFVAGEWYGMKSRMVHSIFFERGTQVLFFEGPTITDETTILEPYCDGEHVETFAVAPWMFKRSAS